MLKQIIKNYKELILKKNYLGENFSFMFIVTHNNKKHLIIIELNIIYLVYYYSLTVKWNHNILKFLTIFWYNGYYQHFS